MIHRILNERKRSNLHQDCLYLYKYKEIYMYWVLFVVLLDLRQGLIVLKSSLFSIISQFVGHGGANFFFFFGGGGGPAGVMAWGGVWWHSVWGVTLEWGWVGNYAIMLFLANNLTWFDIFFLSIRSLLIRHERSTVLYPIILPELWQHVEFVWAAVNLQFSYKYVQ